tara:strand:- start:3030 stop:3551 length:522 start_codon:yes stop_codon:yes gene_type:complete
MKKYLSFLLFIIVLSSCSNNGTEDAVTLDSTNNNSLSNSSVSNTLLRINKDVFEVINSNRINNIKTGEFYSINNAERKGDFIAINLSYSGGCKQHDFEIIWDGIVYTDDPCHMNLILIHNSNNDNCEALITEVININLKELIGDVVYKDSCAYHIFNTYNSDDKAAVIIEGVN